MRMNDINGQGKEISTRKYSSAIRLTRVKKALKNQVDCREARSGERCRARYFPRYFIHVSEIWRPSARGCSQVRHATSRWRQPRRDGDEHYSRRTRPVSGSMASAAGACVLAVFRSVAPRSRSRVCVLAVSWARTKVCCSVGPGISGHRRDGEGERERERRETNVNSSEGSVQPCGEMSRSPCSCHARGCSPLFTTTTHPGIPR